MWEEVHWGNRTANFKRIYQHQYHIQNKKETNGIFKHMEENPNHVIAWENIAFLDQESNWSRRKIKESIY